MLQVCGKDAEDEDTIAAQHQARGQHCYLVALHVIAQGAARTDSRSAVSTSSKSLWTRAWVESRAETPVPSRQHATAAHSMHHLQTSG